MRELALFAGAGGGILGGGLLGWRTVCAVEFNPYCRSVLLARQRDGILEPFPIWDDVRTFDGKPWRGHADVISGGFPCQDISAAGRGAGLSGARSGLWFEYARIIEEVRPPKVFIENSPMLRTRGLERILKDLTALGYDARWGILGASDVGAPHIRKRMWIAAHSRLQRRGAWGDQKPNGPFKDPWGLASQARQGGDLQPWVRAASADDHGSTHCPVVIRKDDGVAHRLERFRAIGNGPVPRVASVAWRLLDDDR